MNELIANSLYKKDERSFRKIKEIVKAFNASFNGNNIIQDDIFHIMENYAAQKETQLEIMKLPIKDEDFCAFTCVRKGIIFVVINSDIPISKQIFAAAHELYHIWCYLSANDDTFQQNGSLLTEDELEEGAGCEEDLEANAFAGLLLMPVTALGEQMDIYGIKKSNITVQDVLILMEIFAIPYKAVILRLIEERYITEKRSNDLLSLTHDEVEKCVRRSHTAVRWQKKTGDNIDIAGLQEKISDNAENELLPESRIKEDTERIEILIRKLGDGGECV